MIEFFAIAITTRYSDKTFGTFLSQVSFICLSGKSCYAVLQVLP